MKIIKQICRLQDIRMNVEIKIVCPFCGQRQMIIEVNRNRCWCIKCKKEKHLDEIFRLVEREYNYKHQDTLNIMNNTTGVCG